MCSALAWLLLTLLFASVSIAAEAPSTDNFIPRRQTQPPGPPLSPQQAIAKMTVPEGFTVELVAAEPDLQNPVAMTFDERGRIWVTESFEYPRSEPGPGRDRIKILEDTDADGRVDKVTVFAEGLNIPSGIAVGYGGVWVANAPDILFLQDTDGDLRADRSEVVVTGFGRSDTHELPNSFTWGPDGWLYGLNGVFNHCHVKQDGREYRFNAAMFRIDPRTRRFELFAEGTSNPWGIAFDTEGSAFVSACVIDHLWHITESGYYHRQAGPYPPFTWKIESIVEHTHQLAAYCGIHYFDSDAYPPEYRGKLYMGNIHGNCINADALERRGSTYRGTSGPDLLTANDVWFMPIVQKTGPDGCLYVLDWYDRYHCYQDARRDPLGVDRGHGRLYRIRYNDTPRAAPFNLAEESDAQLVARLASPNVFYRDLAQRLLAERATPQSRAELQRLVLDEGAKHTTRMHALWALLGGGPLDEKFHQALLAHGNASLRAWGVRAAGNLPQLAEPLASKVAALAGDESADVRLQAIIAAGKRPKLDLLAVALAALGATGGDDPLLPRIAWENLNPNLPQRGGELAAAVVENGLADKPAVAVLLPKAIDRLAVHRPLDVASVARLLELLLSNDTTTEQAREALALLSARVNNGELHAASLDELASRLHGVLAPLLANERHVLHFEAAMLAAALRQPEGLAVARRAFAASAASQDRRVRALDALVAAGDENLLAAVDALLASGNARELPLRQHTLAALGRFDSPRVAEVVLEHYPGMAPRLKPQAIELLVTRPEWSRRLLAAIEAEQVPSAALNVNQVRALLSSDDESLAEQVRAIWGTVRLSRDPAREQVIDQVRQMLAATPGDPHKGQLVFQKVCGQCHEIYGQGHKVGPDITRNGRNDYAQLLSNVLDPSLVIGADYQAHLLATGDGRVLTGLLVEDSPQRVVLKVQGGKQEVVPRENIELMERSGLSMMPEGLEKQLTQQELIDLFAYLVLDKPPSDPAAALLPGAPGGN